MSSKKYQGKWPELIKIAIGPHKNKERMVWLGQRAKGGLINQARALLFSIINSNIEKLHPKLFMEEEEEQWTYSALVEVAYWRLVQIYYRGELKRCKSCGTLFQQTDQRQQFCPKGLKPESFCASKERLKSYREKLKASKGNKIDKRQGGAHHGKKTR